MIYPNFPENVCICGKVLIRWKIGIPFWKYSPAAMCSVAGYVSPGVSSLHLHSSSHIPRSPRTRRGGRTWHAVVILEDLIFYCMSNTWTDRVQFSCWCHDDSTIQCSGKSREDKDQGMRGRGWAEGSAKFHSTWRRPLRGPSPCLSDFTINNLIKTLLNGHLNTVNRLKIGMQTHWW